MPAKLMLASTLNLVWLWVFGATALTLAACARAEDGGRAHPFAEASTDAGSPGPYPVGYTTRSFTYTRPDGVQRTVTTDIWYPGRGTPPAATQSPANAAPNIPPNHDSTHPLVIFSHGHQGTPSNNSVFLSHLASHGYVVAAPEHEDCQTNCSQPDFADETVRRPLDVQSVLDQVLSLTTTTTTNDAILGKMVDPTRVGVAGQSFGGWTALEALHAEARFRAALVMNAATQRPFTDPRKVSRPLLMMTGELDALVPFALTEAFYARLPSTQDRFLLVVPRAGHEVARE